MFYRLLKFIHRSWATGFAHNYQEIHLNAPMVTFTFDDSYGSTFDNAGEILWKNDLRGTFFVSFQFLNGIHEPSFKLPQLKRVLDQGHELGCHTYSHIDLSQIRRQDAIKDIEANQRKLNQVFPGMKFKNFSYPFGAQNYSTKKYVSGNFLSARGNRPGLNHGRVDMSNLKSIKLYEDKYTICDIQEKLDQAIEQKAWIIFHTHDVRPNFSKYGCSPGYFEKVVEACQERSLAIWSIAEAQAILLKPVPMIRLAQVGT